MIAAANIKQCFLEVPNVHVGMAEAVMEALHLYRKGKADFADYLMLAESKAAGAKRLASFDRMLCKEQHFACLPEDCAP